jgi:23S rRNA (cytosine1962-C5)-methyltransferase
VPGGPLNPLENRLKKNRTRLGAYARRHGLTAWRLYDMDMNEFRYSVDIYGNHGIVTVWQGRDTDTQQQAMVVETVARVMEFPAENVHLKVRRKMVWGETQYEKLEARAEKIVVEEQGLKFLVNPWDYLDVGLFLDHRRTRAMVRDEAQGKSVLNLFCYTGSFTVYAAAGGARETVSVDMSNTYTAWAQENLELNGFSGAQHQLVRADVTAWIRQCTQRFDLVVLDPPSFSASKKMDTTWDIQRDHPALIRAVMERLNPGGILYFSTNFRGFVPQDGVWGGATSKELTPGTLPEDIRQKDLHRCWRVVR